MIPTRYEARKGPSWAPRSASKRLAVWRRSGGRFVHAGGRSLARLADALDLDLVAVGLLLLVSAAFVVLFAALVLGLALRVFVFAWQGGA